MNATQLCHDSAWVSSNGLGSSTTRWTAQVVYCKLLINRPLSRNNDCTRLCNSWAFKDRGFINHGDTLTQSLVSVISLLTFWSRCSLSWQPLLGDIKHECRSRLVKDELGIPSYTCNITGCLHLQEEPQKCSRSLTQKTSNLKPFLW